MILFDRSRRSQQLSQRRERIALFRIAISEVIEIDNVDPIGSGELNQTQTREIRIEICGLRIETDCVARREVFDSAAQFFRRCDDSILSVHSRLI